uniref:Recep_L_domain domain-containing protein n=1 Tax=Haemonchus placei TaxID=6290 RepID=A0A0N4VSU2_HAEPC
LVGAEFCSHRRRPRLAFPTPFPSLNICQILQFDRLYKSSLTNESLFIGNTVVDLQTNNTVSVFPD